MWTCFVLQNWLIKEARKTSHYLTLTGCLTVCELDRRIFWDLWGGNQQLSAQLWTQKVSLDFNIAYLGCVWSVQLRQSKIYKVVWAFDSEGISFRAYMLSTYQCCPYSWSNHVCCLFEVQCKVFWTWSFSAKTFLSMLTAKDASCRSILIWMGILGSMLPISA